MFYIIFLSKFLFISIYQVEDILLNYINLLAIHHALTFLLSMRNNFFLFMI